MSRYNIKICSSCVALLRESGYSVERVGDETTPIKLDECAVCGIICGAPMYVVSKEVKNGEAT